MKTRTLLVAALLTLPVTALPGAAQELSHQGQPIGDHVVLVGLPSDERPTFLCEWTRLRPNGKLDGSSFLIPKGQLLVITDVEWEVFLKGNLQHSHDFALMHVKIWLNGGFVGPPVFRSSSTEVGAAGKALWMGTNDQLSTGFVVSPTTPICGHAVVSTLQGSAFVPEISSAVLRGYLIDM